MAKAPRSIRPRPDRMTSSRWLCRLVDLSSPTLNTKILIRPKSIILVKTDSARNCINIHGFEDRASNCILRRSAIGDARTKRILLLVERVQVRPEGLSFLSSVSRFNPSHRDCHIPFKFSISTVHHATPAVSSTSVHVLA